ncbi:AAA family ATPase [Pedobacter sp. P351]|uniref:AAA family ATPase n=1 Tax=Pedobacter superstes TaxID=3133441 RepID=UPI0030A4956D
MDKFIITGGPGSGKTSLIAHLEDLGYSCSKEASRQLIVEQVAKNSDILPWLNLNAFAELVLERMKKLYHETPASAVTFFDRGIPDIMAYLKAVNMPVDGKYYEALKNHPYNPCVFILPPWPEIYVNDQERWQTFAESAALYRAIKETYLELNFQLVEVPEMPLEGRAAYILDVMQIPLNR